MGFEENFSLAWAHMDNFINRKDEAKLFICIFSGYPHSIPLKKASLPILQIGIKVRGVRNMPEVTNILVYDISKLIFITIGASPSASVVKNLAAKPEIQGSVPGLERCPMEGNSNPFQYYYLGNPTAEAPTELQSKESVGSKESNVT